MKSFFSSGTQFFPPFCYFSTYLISLLFLLFPVAPVEKENAREKQRNKIKRGWKRAIEVKKASIQVLSAAELNFHVVHM